MTRQQARVASRSTSQLRIEFRGSRATADAERRGVEGLERQGDRVVLEPAA